MKIIYIVNARIPTEKAHGYQICKMCEEFATAGNEVELWVPTRSSLISDSAFDFYKLKRNFSIQKIKSYDFLKHCQYIGSLALYLQTFFFMSKLFFKKIDKTSVVYTRDANIAWLYAGRGMQVVYESHVWPKRKPGLLMYFLKKVKKIVTISSGLKESFLKAGFSEEQIFVSPSGVDIDNFDIDESRNSARNKINLPQDLYIIGYTGSFKTMGLDKGINCILDLLALLKDKKDVLFLAVGGSKEDIEFYTAVAKQKGVADRVRLLPRVDIAELAVYQKAADVLLMPYPDSAHYSKDMSPLKMFEYMASKRPVIASSLPSIKEVLNEENCYFCKPDNAEDLAEKILFVMDNRELANQKAEMAFLDIKKYSWQNRVDSLINFIRKT